MKKIDSFTDELIKEELNKANQEKYKKQRL